MAVFSDRFYEGPRPSAGGVVAYRAALMDALSATADREHSLKLEAVAITRTITDGIRDVIRQDKHVRRQVLEYGTPPLATWSASLDKLSEHSLGSLERRIGEMERELEHGRIGGFPGTMLLYGKPTFTTFRPFYDVVFGVAHQDE
jgi:hypothetical protein